MGNDKGLDDLIAEAETRLAGAAVGTPEHRAATHELRGLKNRKVIGEMTGPRDANGPTFANPTGGVKT